MIYILLFLLPVVLVVLVLWAGGMALGIIFGRAPYILSARGIGEVIAQELSELKNGSVVYELGSGNGHILKNIAEKRPDLTLIGYEISPYAHFISRLKLWGYKNVGTHYGNFFNKKLERPAAVYFYLLPEIYPKLVSYFQENLTSGTPVLAIDFSFPEKYASQLTLQKKVYFKNQRFYIYRWN